MQLCQKPYHLHWCVSKSSSSGNFKKSTFCNINPKQFSCMSRLKSVMLFFLQMFPKIAGKFPKKSEQFSKIQRYSIKFFMLMPRLPNGRSFALIYLFIISFILIRKRFFLSHIYRNRLFRPLTYKFYKT